MVASLSEFQKYRRAYGMPGKGVSPEMAFQEAERRRAGQEILDGQKFGSGLPAALGIGPEGAPMGGGGLGDQYQSAADAANAATAKRDQEIRGILDERRQNAANLFANTSGGMLSNIYRNQRRRLGAAQVSDAARGFYRSGAGNTSTDRLANSEELTQAQGEIAQKQALLDSQLSKEKADYVERITDQGPDMNQLINLERQAGSGNTAGTYGGGYGNLYGLGGGEGAPAAEQPPMPATAPQPRVRDQGPSGYTSRPSRMTMPVSSSGLSPMTPQNVGPAPAVGVAGQAPASHPDPKLASYIDAFNAGAPKPAPTMPPQIAPAPVAQPPRQVYVSPQSKPMINPQASLRRRTLAGSYPRSYA